jgi:hypothetical protein
MRLYIHNLEAEVYDPLALSEEAVMIITFGGDLVMIVNHGQRNMIL